MSGFNFKTKAWKECNFNRLYARCFKKEKIFTRTKILLHPAIYDTGGMAALECMSYGIPAISYDLKGLKKKLIQ